MGTLFRWIFPDSFLKCFSQQTRPHSRTRSRLSNVRFETPLGVFPWQMLQQRQWRRLGMKGGHRKLSSQLRTILDQFQIIF